MRQYTGWIVEEAGTPTTFRPHRPDQGLLLPPDLGDWLPEGHVAYHVNDLDLSAFYAPYEGDGRRKPPHEPRMMVKVLIHGCATGVFSSRGLARKLDEDVAFRVLASGNFPSHRTICEFRRRHLSDFRRLFVEVVRLAAETGLVNFGKSSIDGTKVRANASKRRAMSCGRMLKEERRLEAEIGALLDRARAADEAHGRQPGEKRNPKGGRPCKRDCGEPEEKAQDNFTDPESRIMKTSAEGFQQCCNAQVAVEGAQQLIVATGVSSNASDRGWLAPLAEDVESTHGTRPTTVLADAGYCNEADLGRLEALGVDGCVALGREGSARGGGGRGEASVQGPHGGEAGGGGAGAARRAQVVVGGAARMDQGGAGISTIQRARPAEGPGGVGSGLPGVEHQADAWASGGLMTGTQPSHGVERGPIQASLGCRAAMRRPTARHRRHENVVPAAPSDSPGLRSSDGAGS